MSKNNSKTSQERLELFKGTFGFIIKGKTSLDKWTPRHYLRKTMILLTSFLLMMLIIIDVKTKNISKKGQPPNIISAYKMAHIASPLLIMMMEIK